DYIMKPFAKEELLARIRVHMEQWELVKELNRTVTQLELLNKLRDEFVAMATHDLKNPLNGIMGFSQILEREESLSDRHRKMVATIKDSSTLMLDIVNDILALSRLETANGESDLAPLSLLPIIHIAEASIQQTAFKKKILIETVNNCPCDAIIDGNRNSLQRIMNNLLSNAIKFTPPDGKVTISVQQDQKQQIILSVTDTGIGIPEDMLPQLFNKFTKSSRHGTEGEPGTGLGLAITKHLVEQQNGTIKVTSQEGQGSCFQLTFPISTSLS
ncbi:MAG: hybrid sensor histidine kinase/response regulator, partial [Desulfobulbaceae bacterium]|nr:hybrid sensor histidine kinase/response regulator [Desulfobulbaceae bacterium]